jgi:hypothetical protein
VERAPQSAAADVTERQVGSVVRAVAVDRDWLAVTSPPHDQFLAATAQPERPPLEVLGGGQYVPARRGTGRKTPCVEIRVGEFHPSPPQEMITSSEGTNWAKPPSTYSSQVEKHHSGTLLVH